jgi:hypothetical protein
MSFLIPLLLLSFGGVDGSLMDRRRGRGKDRERWREDDISQREGVGRYTYIHIHVHTCCMSARSTIIETSQIKKSPHHTLQKHERTNARTYRTHHVHLDQRPTPSHHLHPRTRSHPSRHLQILLESTGEIIHRFSFAYRLCGRDDREGGHQGYS